MANRMIDNRLIPHFSWWIDTHRSAVTTYLLATAITLSTVGCSDTAVDNDLALDQQVRIGNRQYVLELAMDPQSRYQGLSDRQEIPADGGMLFVFPTPRVQQFVMRRCLVPIDLIYLDPAGRVLSTHRMKVEPYDTPDRQLTPYTSPWPAQFVIELAGGTLDTLDLKVGQHVDLPLELLKRRAR